MSRDSVAVPPALAMVANTLCLTRLTDGFCGARNQPTCLKCREAAESLMRHSWLSARALDWVLRHASGIEKAAEQNASVAALTREAAPQASGGDAHAWAVKYDADTFLAMQPMDVSRDFIAGWNTCRAHVIAQKYIATTDSAIQSQQGAAGGDKLPCTDSDNCRRCSEDADTPHSGIPRVTLATR